MNKDYTGYIEVNGIIYPLQQFIDCGMNICYNYHYPEPGSVWTSL